MLLREKIKLGKTLNLKDLIRDKTHHFLGNDGEDIGVFGLSSSIQFLTTTALIQGIEPLRALLNHTHKYMCFTACSKTASFPPLYCLLKEKTQAIYERLFGLVESIAQEREMSLFKRPVRLMVDFEKSFHNEVLPLEAGRHLFCCFFHFVSNMKKKTKPITDSIRRRWEKGSFELMLAEQTKRAIMMLPLLPLELISVEVLDEIIGMRKYAVHPQRNDFDEFRNKLVRNYIRPNARFQKQIWCVCG